jgi:hypothetical protein
MIQLPSRPIDAGMIPATLPSARPIGQNRPVLDFTGFDKPRKPGISSLLKNPKALQAFASLLAGSEQAQAVRSGGSPYAGPSGGFNYYGG